MIEQYHGKILNVHFPNSNQVVLPGSIICDQVINTTNSGVRSQGPTMQNGSDVYFFSGQGTLDQATVKYDILTNTWSTVTTSGTKPNARDRHAGAYINGFLYIFGGYWSGYKQDTHKLNLGTGAWSGALSPAGTIPSVRAYTWAQCCACNEKFYVIGGYNGSVWLRDAYAYTPDETNGTWATLAAPTYLSSAGAVASYGGYVYLVCGTSTGKNYLLRYDPIGDSWTTLALCPNKGNYFTLTSTDDGYLHLLGGYNNRNGVTTYNTTSATQDTWWMYSIIEDRWYAKPPLQWMYEHGKGSYNTAYNFLYHESAAYNSKLYIFYPYMSALSAYKNWTICISNSKLKRYMVTEVEYGI